MTYGCTTTLVLEMHIVTETQAMKATKINRDDVWKKLRWSSQSGGRDLEVSLWASPKQVLLGGVKKSDVLFGGRRVEGSKGRRVEGFSF